MKRALIALVFLLLPFTSAAAQSNWYGTALASAARTAAQVNSADLSNPGARGVHVLINVSAYTAGNYTPKIQAKDPVSGTYYDLLVGVAMSGTGIQVLKIYPGIATVANGAAADILPYTWRVQVNGAAGQSMTFSVAYFTEY